MRKQSYICHEKGGLFFLFTSKVIFELKKLLFLFYSFRALLVVYLLYQLLRNDKSFIRNRFYLITGIILSIVLPLIHFSATSPSLIILPNAVLLDPIIITAGDVSNIKHQHIDIFCLVVFIYLSGIITLMIRDCFQIYKLMRLAKRAGITSKLGYKLVLTKETTAPFSFFNLIFINHQISEEDAKTVLTHEQVHVRQRHSIDVILMEIIAILQWFNPIVWLYRISMREVHEYLADRTTLKSGIEKVGYLQLLFAMALNVKPADVTNNFCQTKLKRRLTMITKNQNAKFSALKFILIIPVLAMFVWLVSCNKTTKENNETVKNNTVAPTEVPPPPPPPPVPDAPSTKNEKVFVIVEEMPSYANGDESFIKFISENIIYPPLAKKNGIQETVYVTFVVEADGTIANAKVLRGIGGGCDEEALRVIKMMPKWNPGKQDGKNVRVQFNLPIKFKLG